MLTILITIPVHETPHQRGHGQAPNGNVGAIDLLSYVACEDPEASSWGLKASPVDEVDAQLLPCTTLVLPKSGPHACGVVPFRDTGLSRVIIGVRVSICLDPLYCGRFSRILCICLRYIYLLHIILFSIGHWVYPGVGTADIWPRVIQSDQDQCMAGVSPTKLLSTLAPVSV
ncbi:unnamed protein product [Closterium sp. NIES-54]